MPNELVITVITTKSIYVKRKCASVDLSRRSQQWGLKNTTNRTTLFDEKK